MIRSVKTKKQVFKDGFSLFLNKPIPNKLLTDYINDTDGQATSELQCWIVNNMKDKINCWCTGIGIIEAVEHLYETAYANGNLSIDCKSLKKRK